MTAGRAGAGLAAGPGSGSEGPRGRGQVATGLLGSQRGARSSLPSRSGLPSRPSRWNPPNPAASPPSGRAPHPGSSPPPVPHTAIGVLRGSRHSCPPQLHPVKARSGPDAAKRVASVGPMVTGRGHAPHDRCDQLTPISSRLEIKYQTEEASSDWISWKKTVGGAGDGSAPGNTVLSSLEAGVPWTPRADLPYFVAFASGNAERGAGAGAAEGGSVLGLPGHTARRSHCFLLVRERSTQDAERPELLPDLRKG
ncbi:PREDICTED: WW domain-binding protein 11-like [Chinchilla lanigera]|uniref:WW domain-binding protein 11-like n=1 Tax=Chinchilla lanigera TaxID=34839 RepID=UPI00038EF20C|nr:PREDICTED: WW domain-binding protein 11-like [Chinchilla lanigera]